MLGRFAFRCMVWRWKLAALLLLHPALYTIATTLRIIK